MSEQPNKKLKDEIERRTRNTSKLIELEAQKLAVGEMVLERLEEILALLRTAGFKIPTVPKAVVAQVTDSHPVPPNSVIAQATQGLAASAPPIKNPCSVCGQEAAFDEPMPNGTKKYYCRPHGQQRAREKAEEAQTAALMGSNGTMFARPANPAAANPQKTIIQAEPPDPLKGPFPNGGGGEPPPNNVLDE
jgi:hypothetical protein